jgi:hypothetical protein
MGMGLDPQNIDLSVFSNFKASGDADPGKNSA